MAVESGFTGTTENSFSIGDGLDGYKYIYVNVDGSYDPGIRWNPDDVQLEFSNDGYIWTAVGSGGGGTQYPTTLYRDTTPVVYTTTPTGVENTLIIDGYVALDEDISFGIITINTTNSHDGKNLYITSQTTSTSDITQYIGGDLTLESGDGYIAGNIYLNAGNSSIGNICLLSNNVDSWNEGEGIIFIQDSTTVPNGNPNNGGYLYSESGSLKWRGSSGTITIIAPA